MALLILVVDSVEAEEKRFTRGTRNMVDGNHSWFVLVFTKSSIP